MSIESTKKTQNNYKRCQNLSLGTIMNTNKKNDTLIADRSMAGASQKKLRSYACSIT